MHYGTLSMEKAMLDIPFTRTHHSLMSCNSVSWLQNCGPCSLSHPIHLSTNSPPIDLQESFPNDFFEPLEMSIFFISMPFFCQCRLGVPPSTKSTCCIDAFVVWSFCVAESHNFQ